jgi:hypothetical protein
MQSLWGKGASTTGILDGIEPRSVLTSQIMPKTMAPRNTKAVSAASAFSRVDSVMLPPVQHIAGLSTATRPGLICSPGSAAVDVFQEVVTLSISAKRK